MENIMSPEIVTDEERMIRAAIAVANTLMDINDTLKDISDGQENIVKRLDRIADDLEDEDGRSIGRAVSCLDYNIDDALVDKEDGKRFRIDGDVQAVTYPQQ